MAAVAAGRGGIGWVQGEPGIGKSALVDAVAADAAVRGLTILRGGADELLSAFPLRLMAECLGVSPRATQPLRREIALLLRGESNGSTLDPVLAAGERMLELVDQVAAVKPLLLVTEDLQWADEPSLLLWNRLARGIDQVPLLLIGTCRPSPRRTMVSRLAAGARDRGGVVLDLGPLAHPRVLQIAQGFAASPPGPRLSAELTRAGGNPLYVRELVEALLRDGAMEVTGGVAEMRADAPATPHTLTAAIGRRVSFLADDTVQALRMAALLGKEFDLGELTAVTGRSAAALTDAVTEAVAAGVLSDTGRRLAFRHDLIRQVLVEQVPAAVRGALHNQIARHLADTNASLDRIAQHLLAAPDGLETWALEGLASAPAATLYTAPQAAAELLARGMATLPETDPRWEELSYRLVQVWFWLGRDQDVIENAGAAISRTSDLERAARMRIYLMRAAGRMARFDDALTAVTPVATDQQLPQLWRARLGASLAMVLVYLSRPAEARETARQALREARQCDDRVAAAYALSALAPISDAATQFALLEEALQALADVDDDPDAMDLRIMVASNHVTRLTAAGRRDEAFAEAARRLVEAERIGTYRYAMLLSTVAAASYTFGRWDETLVHLASIGAEFQDNLALRYWHGLVALVALHREQRDVAESHLRAAGLDEYLEPSAHARYIGSVTEAAAIIAETTGDLDRALALRASWLDLPPGPARENGYQQTPYLLRTALATGETAIAEAALAACEAASDGTAIRTLVTRCCRAMLADDAAELVAVGEQQYAHGWPLSAGTSLEEAAVRLAGRGDTAAARKALTDAARWYDELGATWDIRRADARLRRYGIQRGSRSLHRRATTGWAALTPSEDRIARLVAKGLSNPAIAAELFLSRNTVQTHVSNILSKLQLRSRLELVRNAPAVVRQP